MSNDNTRLVTRDDWHIDIQRSTIRPAPHLPEVSLSSAAHILADLLDGRTAVVGGVTPTGWAVYTPLGTSTCPLGDLEEEVRETLDRARKAQR